MGESVYRRSVVEVKRSQSRGSGGFAEIESFDFSGDLAPLAELCTEADGIVRASTLASKLALDRGSMLPNAVYVIGAKDVTGVHKIGYANNPFSRLSALQIGNWNKLKLVSLLWTERAPEVERLALTAASEMGVRISGEWLAVDETEAIELVLKAARYAKVRAYDSAAHLRNLASRTAALAKTKQALRDAA